MMEQMELGLVELCPHCHYVEGIGHVWCDRTNGVVWTDCGLPFYGEFAPCSYAPIDNSPEACARRVKWFQDHRGEY